MITTESPDFLGGDSLLHKRGNIWEFFGPSVWLFKDYVTRFPRKMEVHKFEAFSVLSNPIGWSWYKLVTMNHPAEHMEFKNGGFAKICLRLQTWRHFRYQFVRIWGCSLKHVLRIRRCRKFCFVCKVALLMAIHEGRWCYLIYLHHIYSSGTACFSIAFELLLATRFPVSSRTLLANLANGMASWIL